MSSRRAPSPAAAGGGLAGALLRRMARAAGLRALVGIEAAGRGGRVAVAAGHRGGFPGWPGVGCGSSSSSSAASFSLTRAQARRAAGSAARTRPPSESNGWITGGSASEDGRLSWGFSSFKGRRPSMEDRFSIKIETIDRQTVGLFGVFDGHGGPLAAEYLKEHLFENLVQHPEFLKDTKLAISQTFLKTDADFLESVSSNPFRDDGSTAVTAILVGNQLYVANVGDSRAVALEAGKAVPLSEDHKPNRKDEQKRIEDAGGIIVLDDTWRVNGLLAMSRAFGNCALKQYVKAEPDIQEKTIDESLEYLILATDGLWDVMRNEDVISQLKAQDGPEAAAMKLTEVAHSRLSLDNITCLVLEFHHEKSASSSLHSFPLLRNGAAAPRFFSSRGRGRAGALAKSLIEDEEIDDDDEDEAGLNDWIREAFFLSISSDEEGEAPSTRESAAPSGGGGCRRGRKNSERPPLRLRFDGGEDGCSNDGEFSWGYSSFKGKRPSMEDRFSIKLTTIDGQTIGLFGVFDGHCGPRAAEYLKQHLFENLVKHPKFLKDTKLAITVTAILIGNRLYVANVGDSRAVALKAGKAVPLSKDHKPNRKDERKRIEAAGGIVSVDDTWRVNRNLAVSRAFGNHAMKRYVIANPDIQEKVVGEGFEYLVLASDGLWDVIRNEDVVSLLKGQDGPKVAAMKLTEVAHSRFTLDNVTCIVLQFHHGKSTNSK
uniref:protein-serine/threonine phosphatase n=1 Tax=Leersia perrieri TaxID=77586 RepID=A0A0D9WQU1_9ORYZ